MDYKWLIEELRRIYTFSGEWMVDGKEKWALEAAAKAIETLLAERDKIRCRMTPLALERYNRGIFGCLEVCDVSERDQGGWVRVTPETMPPEGKAILMTVEYDDEEIPKRLTKIGTWAGRDFGFISLIDFFGGWENLREEIKVTHWMFIPEPAED